MLTLERLLLAGGLTLDDENPRPPLPFEAAVKLPPLRPLDGIALPVRGGSVCPLMCLVAQQFSRLCESRPHREQCLPVLV